MSVGYIRRNLHYALPDYWSAGLRAVYRRLTKSSIFLGSEEELGMCSLLAAKKIDRLLQLVEPSSVLDVGCGTGRAVAYMADKGLSVRGVEGSRAAIRKGERPSLVERHDLRRPLDMGRTFDLVWCFEVAEHIHARYVETFLDNLARHGRIVAISAAPPGQGGEGHFNEQPKSYWIEKFAVRDYRLHDDWSRELQAVPEFYSENMMVFVAA